MQKRIGELLHQWGRTYQAINKYDVALDYLEKSLKWRTDLGDLKEIAYARFQIFIVNEAKGEYKDGYPSQYIYELINYLHKVEDDLHMKGQFKDKNVIRHDRAYLHQQLGDKECEMGVVSKSKQETNNAIQLYKDCIEERKSIFDVGGIAMAEHRLSECLFNLAKISLKEGKINLISAYILEAYEHLQIANDFYMKIGDSYRVDQINETRKKLDKFSYELNINLEIPRNP